MTGRELGFSPTKALREAAFLAYAALALFLLIALGTFHAGDPGWSHSGTDQPIANGAGAVGAWLADFFLSWFGVMAFVAPFLLGAYGFSVFQGSRADGAFQPFHSLLRWSGLLLALAAGAGLADLHLVRPPLVLPESGGGILGREMADLLLDAFGVTGASILLSAAFLVGVLFFTGLSWLGLVDGLGRIALSIGNGFLAVFAGLAKPASVPAGMSEPAPAPVPPGGSGKTKTRRIEPQIKRESPPAAPAGAARPLTVRKPATAAVPVLPASSGQLPSLDLLNHQAPPVRAYTEAALEAMSQRVESILADFGVDVEVVEVHPGPVITRFELQLAAGLKVVRISGLAKDLARALSITSVRVVENIPGKSVVGLEIPNQEREMVLLYSVLASETYQLQNSPLTLVLGKDIGGQPVVANLAKMPHLLVAGTTGSGKSVAINVMILSMLFKARPEAVRLIMIDPKMLELSVYEGIPHLLTPVVTDMKEAANALRWCVAEMERRYKLMSLVGVRNLDGFNQKVVAAAQSGTPLRDPLWRPDLALEEDEAPVLTALPNIVIVIDELADMMMIVGKKVEELIARLAQKARAAGLHLILATQRPSVDVITGLIKANIPTRIAFQVSSRIDSRTIIDQGGAETLLGNGDMLYLPPGTGLPMRAHGAFVSDQEVHNVVDFLKRTGHPHYLDEITRFSEEGSDFNGYRGGGDAGEEADPIYDEAVRFVTETRKASISSVQRRFKVGYNRAARMIEDMEKAGIVGPAETNGSREVLAPPPPEA